MATETVGIGKDSLTPKQIEKQEQARQNRINGFNAAARAHETFLNEMNFDSPGTSGTEESGLGGWSDYVARALESARKIKKEGIKD